MATIASSSTLVQGASSLHRTHSFNFDDLQSVKRTTSTPDVALGRVMVDGLSAPYYVCRWSDSETIARPPPPSPPLPPLPPPPPPSSTKLTRSAAPATGNTPPPPPPPTKSIAKASKSTAPPPPPPPSTKLVTLVSKTTALPPPPPPPPPPFIKPVPQISIARPSNTSLSQHKLKPVPSISSLSTPSSPSPSIPPKPLPITLSYESYDILTPYPDGDAMIYVPLGRTMNFRGRYFPLTPEILAALELKGTPLSLPREKLQDGIYLPLSECELGPPFRLSDKDEQGRARYTKYPICVNIPSAIQIANTKINEDERSVTIPPSALLTVVRLGSAHLVPVEVMWSVDLGYSKAVNSQMGYLERLGVLGGKQPGVWVWEGLGDLEVVDGERQGVREEDGKRKGTGKKVRYCAEGIDENQVAKGPMKPKSREVIEREEEEERMALLLDELEEGMVGEEDVP